MLSPSRNHGCAVARWLARESVAGMTPRLTILHVGKYYPPAPGGMEKVVQLLCESERAGGRLDSRVLVSNTGPRTARESLHGVPVTRVAALGAIGSVGIKPQSPSSVPA